MLGLRHAGPVNCRHSLQAARDAHVDGVRRLRAREAELERREAEVREGGF
jgi:hypothetical protein